jgi:hypothetical protein
LSTWVSWRLEHSSRLLRHRDHRGTEVTEKAKIIENGEPIDYRDGTSSKHPPYVAETALTGS